MKNCNCGCNRNYNRTCPNSRTNNYSTGNNFGTNTGNFSNSFNNSNNNNPFPTNYLYGHAYTPNQMMTNTFDPETGLMHGTIFPELVSPYSPGQSIDFIEYLKNTNRNGGCGCE